MLYEIIHSDCKEAIKQLIAKGIQVDSIITDPPYELGFMNKVWDATGIAYDKELWELCLQILKPGGHLLAFSGSRTYHRMACAIEDAGFEVRDQIMWIYGQGFPKSLDVSKAIDKMKGAKREIIGYDDELAKRIRTKINNNIPYDQINNLKNKIIDSGSIPITEPATDLAKQWNGWGSALKPAHEPIVMARKLLSEKNIASNVIKHGTGAINIDECRIESTGEHMRPYQPTNNDRNILGKQDGFMPTNAAGRFPANIIHDGSEEVEEEFAKYGETISVKRGKRNGNAPRGRDIFVINRTIDIERGHSDKGTPSRFFYSAKASKEDRNGSKHPTVKPINLMKYLCRLVTPPGGLILDPFAGSGTTGQAAIEQDFKVILIEKEAEYIEDIKRRMKDIPLTFWQLQDKEAQLKL